MLENGLLLKSPTCESTNLSPERGQGSNATTIYHSFSLASSSCSSIHVAFLHFQFIFSILALASWSRFGLLGLTSIFDSTDSDELIATRRQGNYNVGTIQDKWWTIMDANSMGSETQVKRSLHKEVVEEEWEDRVRRLYKKKKIVDLRARRSEKSEEKEEKMKDFGNFTRLT